MTLVDDVPAAAERAGVQHDEWLRRFESPAGHHADLLTVDQRLSPGRLVIKGRFEVAEPGGQFQ